MIIELDKNWWIESDISSWNLYYEKAGEINPSTGRPTLSKDASYHANLPAALNWYLNHTMKKSQSITDVLERIKEAEKNIVKACAGIAR